MHKTREVLRLYIDLNLRQRQIAAAPNTQRCPGLIPAEESSPPKCQRRSWLNSLGDTAHVELLISDLAASF